MLSFSAIAQIPLVRRLTQRMALLAAAGSMVAVLSARDASAQTEDGAASSQPPPAAAPAGDDPAGQPFTAGWDHGISVESADHVYKVQFGGLIQGDGRFAINEPAVVDTFVLRRVRPILQGRVARVFEFRLMPDFANSTLILFDAYIDTVFSNAFRIRVGKDKVPVGLEQLQMDYSTLFTERSLATNLVPNRDIGVQIRGDLKAGTASYIASVVNGVPDAANGDAATNNGKDFNARLTIRPFASTRVRDVLGDFGVAIAGSRGRQIGALPSFKTTDQQTFFSYSPVAAAAGLRTHLSPSAFYYYKSFLAFGEYVRSEQVVSTSKVNATLVNTAWELTGSVVLTGEHAAYRNIGRLGADVVPKHPFAPGQRTWGAVQLIARYSALTIDPRAFTLGLATTGASQQAHAYTVGIDWYLNEYVKYVVAFERTVFDHNPSGPRKPENAVTFRVQLNLQPTT
jgi:phosphate-selective porin OprO and OprP